MQVALEFILIGEQGLKLVGCKSARDRTTAFIASVIRMMKEPLAMVNWATLQRGVASELATGHLFRAMSYHAPIVKLKPVHENYVQLLRAEVNEEIKNLKPFTKKLKLLTEEQITKLNLQSQTHLFHTTNYTECERDKPLAKTHHFWCGLFAKTNSRCEDDLAEDEKKMNVKPFY
jgi:hypothetical protein